MDQPLDPIGKLKYYYDTESQEKVPIDRENGPDDWEAGRIPDFLIKKH